MTEHQLQLACAQFLDACLPVDAVWCHCPNEGKRTKTAGARLKAEGLKPGWPDIQILYRGRMYFIELKVGRRKRSPEQKDMQARIAKAGAPVFAECRSVEAMEAFVEQHVPLRGRIAA